jgi:hypothetical protein
MNRYIQQLAHLNLPTVDDPSVWGDEEPKEQPFVMPPVSFNSTGSAADLQSRIHGLINTKTILKTYRENDQ